MILLLFFYPSNLPCFAIFVEFSDFVEFDVARTLRNREIKCIYKNSGIREAV